MRVIGIQSCCAGKQIVDFPNAHHEAPKSDKDTVIELLNCMKNCGTNFVCGFVNITQNKQMKPIFAALGWSHQSCGRRVHGYIHKNPGLWFKELGYPPPRLSVNVEYMKLHPEMYLKNTIEYWEGVHTKILREVEKTKPKKEEFIKSLEKFGIQAADINFL